MSSFLKESSNPVIVKRIEALLFVASDGITTEQLVSILGQNKGEVLKGIEVLKEHYREDHALDITYLAGAWFISTTPDIADVIEQFRRESEENRIRLSKAALETLAVIAYNQPVIRSEVEEIRGVRCERVIETLLNHGFIRIAGRRKSTGSPLLYRTTDVFLQTFGLGAISDLPTVEEIDELRSEREERHQEDENEA